MEPEFLPCPCCRTVTLAEIPPCADDHDGQCPDRACTVCGTALTVGGRPLLSPVMSAMCAEPAGTRSAA